MAMGEILDKIKRGDFLVDEWCNIHSKYEMLSLKEKLYAEVMTMGMERGKIVHTGSNEIKTKGIGGLTEQEQREQKNMFEILSRLDNWLFFDGSNNDLQRFIIALNKIGYRLNEAQLYLGRNYEEHIKQVVGLVSILENLNEDALYNQEDIKKECELNRNKFEKKIEHLLKYDIKYWEDSISSFRKNWFKSVDEIVEQGYWTDEQKNNYKTFFSHLDYLFIVRLKQFQKVFRKPFEKAKKETSTTNQIPDELNTEESKKYLERAIKLGLMNERYEWLKGKQLCAYFASEMSKRLKLGKGIVGGKDGSTRTSWKPFEELFGIENGKLRQNMNDIQKTNVYPMGWELVDKVFE